MVKKRLLVFHPSLAPYRIDLFNRLNAAFNAKFYFYRRNITTQKFNQQLLLKQLNFIPGFLNLGIHIGLKNRLIHVGVAKKIFKIKPEIILCSEYSITTLTALLYSKIVLPKTKVYTLCDDSLEVAKDCRGIRKFARSLAVKWIDGIILCNKPAEEWYRKRFPHVNLFTFPIIQDEIKLRDLIPKITHLVLKIKKQYFIDADNVFLYVGRLSAEKNLRVLINAYAKYLASSNKKSLLCLVGDGSEKEDLVVLTQQLGVEKEVLFPGRYEDKELYAWYLAANCFVLPSTYEPFGAVVNEALIFGLPVICSSAAGSSYLINSKNGHIFNPINENELVELMSNLSEKGRLEASLMPLSFKTEVERLIQFTSQ
jgi:glycosyltransferase involved in cell wall biosynthesis